MKILTNCVICKRLRHGCAPLCALFINGSYAHMGALYANLEKGAKRRITLQKLNFRAKHFMTRICYAYIVYELREFACVSARYFSIAC